MLPLPQKLIQQLEYSLRTGWALLVILLIQYYYPWSPVFLGLSAVIAIICPAKWFGTWQENVIKVGYSSVVGSLIGAGVSACPSKEAILVTLFLGLLFMNCISGWDRLTKVIGTLSLIIAALIPSISNEVVSPLLSCQYTLAVANFPLLIWGFTLLFPFPSFAFQKSKPEITAASKKLSSMVQALVKAFLSSDSVDLHCANYDQLLLELRAEIDTLKLLQKYSANEALLFPHISKVPNYLLLYIKTMESIILDLDALRDSVKNIIYNNTQLYFVHKLERYLLSITDEMELILTIIGEYLTLFPLIQLPSVMKRNSIITNERVLLIESMKKERTRKEADEKDERRQSVDETEDEHRTVFHYSFQGANQERVRLLCRERSNSSSSIPFLQEQELSNPNLTEEEYLKIYFHHEFHQTLKHLLSLREQLFTGFNLVRKKYINFSEESDSIRLRGFDPSLLCETDPSILIDEDLLRMTLQEENHRFSFRNFGPRCSYLHELSIVLEQAFNFTKIFESDISSQRISLFYYIVQILKNIGDVFVLYINATLTFCLDLFNAVQKCLILFILCIFTRDTEHIDAFRQLIQMFFVRYIQPFKLSLIVAIAGSIPIYNIFPGLLENGAWTVFVTVFIRQDTLSSSFQISYQRLEGTVIGSIYAFIVYELFPCNTNDTDLICIHQIYLQSIVLVIWITCCCFFREGEQHGYSAVVAGFTPFVLLLTASTTGQFGTFCRIEENFIGIGIYLIVDYCIFPRRMYPLVKQSVLKCIKMTNDVIRENADTVEKMGRYETIKFRLPTSELLNLLDNRLPSMPEIEPSERRKSIDLMSLYHLFQYETVSMKRLNSDAVAEDIELGPISPSSIETQQFPSTSKTPEQYEYDVRELTSIDQNSQKIVAIYDECKRSVSSSETKLHSVREELAKQSIYLKAVLHEPNPLFYSFPWSSYDQLHHKFQTVYRSSCALNNSSKSLIMVICQMLEKEEVISVYLQHLSFLIKHVLILTHKSDEALSLTYEAFERIYENHDFSVDLQPLLTLRGSCDRLLHSVDDHFRNVYLHNSSEILSNFNPYFIVALFSLFECVIQLIHSLNELGMALHMVRNVEAYQNKPK